MPSHSKHRSPPCDCLNETAPVVARDSGPYLGCDYCNEEPYGALCAYKLLFECSYYTQGDSYYTRGGERFTVPCMIVRKDCPEGCTYSSKWVSIPGQHDIPVLESLGCTIRNYDCGLCEWRQFTLILDNVIMPVTVEIFGGGSGGPVTLSGSYCLAYNNSRSEELGGCVYSSVLDAAVYEDVGGDLIPGEFVVIIELRLFNYGERIGASLEFMYQCVVAEGSPPRICEYSVPVNGFECSEAIFPFEDGNVAEFEQPSAKGYLQRRLSDQGCPVDGDRETIEGWTGGCTWQSQPCSEFGAECFTKAILTITGPTTATVEGFTRSGRSYLYETENWNCYDRSQFQLVRMDRECAGIPTCLCVAPVNAPVADSDCSGDCCDDGASSRDFTFIADVMCGDVVVIPKDTYSFQRGPWIGDIPAPCGVSDPGGTGCSYFWREFAFTDLNGPCDEWDNLVGVLLQCAGVTEEPPTGVDPDADRVMVVTSYCYRKDLACWETSSQQTLYYRCCEGNQFIGVPGFGCCCPEPIVVCCCEDALLPSYTLEVRDASNNTVATVEVEYNATTQIWETEPFTAGSCEVEKLWFRCAPEPYCQWESYVVFSGSPINNALLRIATPCDPFYLQWLMESANCLQGHSFYIT